MKCDVSRRQSLQKSEFVKVRQLSFLGARRQVDHIETKLGCLEQLHDCNGCTECIG
jgi:hypothetical protein